VTQLTVNALSKQTIMNKFYTITNKSFDELGVTSQKELWEKVKSDHKGLSTTVETVFTKIEGNDNRFKVVMSKAEEDRHGDIVHQNWQLESFRKNPVFLDSHNYSSIEHILGKIHNIRVENNMLQGEIEFMLDNPKGMLAYKMALGGFLNATSVGFIPKAFNDQGHITESELLEDSAVSVPALASALIERGIDIEEVKEGEEEKEDDIDVVNPEPDTTEEPESTETDEEEGEESEIEEEIEEKKVDKTLEAIRAINKREARKQELLKESLGVIRQLQEKKHDVNSQKRMVNRAIKQLLKLK
jgi:phage head maturation protease